MNIGYKNQKQSRSFLLEKMAVTENEKDLRVCVTSDLKYTQKCIEAEKSLWKF